MSISKLGAAEHGSLLLSLRKDCNTLQDTTHLMCARYNEELSAQEVGDLYASIRMGGVSLRQVMAAIAKVCGKDGRGKATKSRMSSIFLELDRRYFIVENARWEFSMLDSCREGQISERNAMNLFKTVQGSLFNGSWTLFQKKRLNPGSKVAWEEIEVPLCEIVPDEALDEHLNTNNTQEELKSSDVLESKPLDIPVDNTSDDESNPSRKLEVEREEELQDAKSREKRLSESVEREQTALREAKVAEQRIHLATKLKNAIASRKVADLEAALEQVKREGLEGELSKSVTEATALLEKLRKLEQRKRAVLELSQRVIAELKSYSQPPALVHQVMIATFLLLGSPEKQTKSWQATQVLIGKTGKASLKRRVSECTVDSISMAVAQRVGTILSRYEFLTVQDTSLGCAAFHAWAEGMVEEVLAVSES